MLYWKHKCSGGTKHQEKKNAEDEWCGRCLLMSHTLDNVTKLKAVLYHNRYLSVKIDNRWSDTSKIHCARNHHDRLAKTENLCHISSQGFGLREKSAKTFLEPILTGDGMCIFEYVPETKCQNSWMANYHVSSTTWASQTLN